jgi:phosphate transport system substrate-binding protein
MKTATFAKVLFRIFLFFVVFGLPRAVTANVESIKIGGTGAALGTMKHLARAFEAKHPGVAITVLPSLGSSGGIRALIGGAIHLAVSARPLKKKEWAPGVIASAFGRTAIVFATAADVSRTDFTTAELIKIYDGTTKSWANGENIRILLRPDSETDTKLMRDLLPGMSAAIDAAKRRRGVPVMYTDQEIADAIARIPGALGPTTLCLNLAENRGFRIFSINGIKPTPETIVDGTYPITKSFYLVTGPESGKTVGKFVTFVRSPEGAAILRRLGHHVLSAGKSP